jgi:hypothetical protein
VSDRNQREVCRQGGEWGHLGEGRAGGLDGVADALGVAAVLAVEHLQGRHLRPRVREFRGQAAVVLQRMSGDEIKRVRGVCR